MGMWKGAMVAVAGLFALAGCDKTTESESGSTANPSALVGTWWQVDSTPETGFSNHDTSWVVFAADGGYADISHVNSKNLSTGYLQHSEDTSTGTWSVAGNKLKLSVNATTLDAEELRTVEMAYSISGTVLTVVNSKGNTHSISRISDKASVPTLANRPGVFR